MKNTRIEGMDYLRAIMSIFVVVWHMGGGGRSLIFSKDKYLEHVFTISDLINFNMLLLAVPTFIFISNFLYAFGGVNNATLRKRIKRILILLTFWPIAFTTWVGGYNGLSNLLPNSLSMLAYTVLTAGDTVYYFLVSLIVCILLTHLIAKLKLRLQILGFLLSLVILAGLPELTIMLDFYPLSAFWSPLNFIPFPFAAVLIAKNIDYVRLKVKFLASAAIVLFVILSIFEWNYSVGGIFFPSEGHAIPAYTRTSLLFGSIALLLIAIDPRIRSNGIIKYMSKHSLALYCLHPFLMAPIIILVAKVVQNEIILTYASIILVILFSYVIAAMLRIYYLKEEVIT